MYLQMQENLRKLTQISANLIDCATQICANLAQFRAKILRKGSKFGANLCANFAQIAQANLHWKPYLPVIFFIELANHLSDLLSVEALHQLTY